MLNEFGSSLRDFYQYSLVDTVEGTLQIFHSFTYGEMIISFLLLLILLVMVFKWIWEVYSVIGYTSYEMYSQYTVFVIPLFCS